MAILLASFYLLPAAFLVLLFWCLWQLIKCIGLPLWWLRLTFAFLAALLFAPVIVAAGTINVAWVPHALLFLDFDLSYYAHFGKYVFSSLAITFLVMGIGAWAGIREAMPARAPSRRVVLLSLFAIATTILAYVLAFPQRDIPEIITTAAIERLFGDRLDDVVALHDLSDPEAKRRGADELKAAFSSDAAIIHVALEDPGYQHTVYGNAFYFYQDDLQPTNTSCSGASPPEQVGLIRCSWKGGGADRRNVIRYRRFFVFEDERLELIVEFDFDELRDALSANGS